MLWTKESKRQMHHKKVLARWGTLYARYEPPWLAWECWRILQVSSSSSLLLSSLELSHTTIYET